METLNRQNVPPKPGPREEIFRVKPTTGFRGQIISHNLWGVWTHWDGYRTRECTARVVLPDEPQPTDEEGGNDVHPSMQAPPMQGTKCRGHLAKWPLRWKGYLHVYDASTKKFGFLEITPGAAEQLLRQVPSDGNLRGLLLRIDRHGTSIRSKCTVELTRPAGGSDNLPDPADPEETLRALWGWPHGA